MSPPVRPVVGGELTGRWIRDNRCKCQKPSSIYSINKFSSNCEICLYIKVPCTLYFMLSFCHYILFRYERQNSYKTVSSGQFSYNMWGWIFLHNGELAETEGRFNLDKYIHQHSACTGLARINHIRAG